MIFAKRLVALRNDRSLTQEEVGKVIGVGKTTISNYERGYSTPDAETIVTLADYFAVTTDYLLGRDVIDVKINVDPEKIGNMSDVQKLADEAMETLNMALASGILTEEQARLSLKMYRQSLLVMIEEKKE